jgi:hypothetical protein
MSVRLKKVCQFPLGAKFVLHSCFQSIPINKIIFFVVMCSPPQIRLWRREIVLQLFHSETKPMNERTNERTNPFQEILLKHFFLSCFYSSAGVLLSSVWRSVTNELLLKMFFLWNFKILYFFFVFQRITWMSPKRDREMCLVKGKSEVSKKKKILKTFFVVFQWSFVFNSNYIEMF